ncbi:hypothetical protein MLD38_015323 [Melastoma candidum]|uniref:Uncharacterized protein n=1 Tax=Melastoma candidum TaxID=119954 RepID=A0ACB9RFL8_9MYRT|nr:hypothetical protein MLD38_015323 [Melastoma candidum]
MEWRTSRFIPANFDLLGKKTRFFPSFLHLGRIYKSFQATSAFFPVPSSADPLTKPAQKVNGVSSLKPPAPTRLGVKANARAPHKVNGTPVGLATAPEPVKFDDSPAAPPPRTFINQLPDWSVLLAAITTVFLEAEKQWTLLDWKPKRPDILVDPFGLGSIVQGGLVFLQDFSIRSYEIGADRTASIETIMNHL